PDAADAFPLDPRESVDTDRDGIGNNADLDDDGDGVPDTTDAFPLDPSESVDTDGDGVGDNADSDDDNDGDPDPTDCQPLNDAVHRGAAEVAGNGIDDNCNGEIDEVANEVVFVGLQAPYAPPPTAFRTNRTIPLSWQYADMQGLVIPTPGAAPTVNVWGPVACGETTGGATIEVNAAGESGYQYDASTNTWRFNWHTTSVPVGCYYIQITSPALPASQLFAIRLR
ncbi:MAG: PxKF domain-containing protein, partial [Acidobacteriota bacterium]